MPYVVTYSRNGHVLNNYLLILLVKLWLLLVILSRLGVSTTYVSILQVQHISKGPKMY